MLDLSKLDETDQERVEEYLRLCAGPPKEVDSMLPEGWQMLSDLGTLPDGREYYVEYLQGSRKIGSGWTSLREPFDKDLVARAKAYERTKESGQPTCVITTIAKKARNSVFPKYVKVPVVAFYEKDGRVFIAVNIGDGRFVEQEIRHSADIAGENIKVVSTNDPAIDIRTKTCLERLEHTT